MKRKLLVLPALVGLIAPVLAGCGGSGGSGSSDKAIVVGSTDSIVVSKDNPAPLDPATSYDAATWNILSNTFQMLLRLPRSGTTPEPDAAKSCAFSDTQSETYRCTLRDGLTFSNGDALTAEDVKFSFERMLKINSDLGPASLLSGLKKVETPNDKTVVFDLKAPDATFPYKLATPAGAIVDGQVYQPDKPYDGLKVLGSGPYKLDSFNQGDSAVLSKNDSYKGNVTLKNSKIEVKFFDDSSKMKDALAAGTVDVVAGSNAFKPAEIQSMQDGKVKGVTLTEGSGTETRYLVFNTKFQSVQPKAVREAVADILDRSTLARDTYQRTVDPLYSIVPQGISGHKNSFYNLYGEPSTTKASQVLQSANISTPVKITYTYRTTAGSSAGEEALWLQKSLNATGLFDVSLKKVDYGTFVGNAIKGKYAFYGIGWAPDFPDADNYIAPFISDNFLQLPYTSPTITGTLLPHTREQAARETTSSDFGKMQDIVAKDIPLIPLWQAKGYVASRSDITGVEWVLNSSSTIQYWELGRGMTG
jgi:peptide/nickel transport system substrate-binding protein